MANYANTNAMVSFAMFILPGEDKATRSFGSQLKNDLGDEADVTQLSLNIDEYPSEASDYSGFQFDVLNLVPVVELIVVSVEVAKLSGLLDELEGSTDCDPEADLITIDEETLVDDPASWIGSAHWDSLPDRAKKRLAASYQEYAAGSYVGVIEQSSTAVEALFLDSVNQENRSDDEVWASIFQRIDDDWQNSADDLYVHLGLLYNLDITKSGGDMSREDAIAAILSTRELVELVT